jgi:monoamine oxidase
MPRIRLPKVTHIGREEKGYSVTLDNGKVLYAEGCIVTAPHKLHLDGTLRKT